MWQVFMSKLKNRCYTLNALVLLQKSIGVSNSFDENMGDRMTANQSNRDSTLSIITQAFKSADNTLRKNGRQEHLHY
jgi:hypothetical protein